MKRRLTLHLAKGNASSDKNHLFRNVSLITIGLVLLTLPFVFSTSGNAQRGKLLTAQDHSKPVETARAVYQSPGNRHKVAVSDDEAASMLKARGARLIADYSSYKVYETDTDVMNSLAGDTRVQLRDEDNVIQLNAGHLDTSQDELQASRSAIGTFPGKRMHLIQFVGPIQADWYKSLAATGVRIVTYIPSNAYLVYGDSSTLNRVRSFATRSKIVQWDGEYKDEFRIDPSVSNVANKAAQGKVAPGGIRIEGSPDDGYFSIQLVRDKAENDQTLRLIDSLKLEPITSQDEALGYVDLVVRMANESVLELAKRGDVVSIQAQPTPVKFDERQNWIISGNLTPTPGDYLAYLTSHGFNLSAATTFGVNISDSGVDNGTSLPNHFAFYLLGNPIPANSRVVYNRLEGTPNAGSTLQGCDGHGNLNAHIMSGYVPTGTVGTVNFGAFPHADAQGFRYGLGVAPFIKLGSSVIFDPDTFTNPDFEDLESKAYNDGMRISSNSWGANSGGAYTAASQRYDALVRDAQPSGSTFPVAGNQEYVILFASGNAGPGANTIGAPGTGKNVITVGAGEGVQAFGGSDFCGIGDSGADNANDVIGFSSRGPTDDGRQKPDIMAPGTHISGGVAQQTLISPTGSGNGDDIACFNGDGVCGGVGINFFPAGQQWNTASSGTSHSTPAVSGLAALMRQFFINLGSAPPTPAMTKALMVNTARYMTGTGANDTLPSNNQGMGEANVQSFFDVFAIGHILRDQVPADRFTASGQQRVFTGTVVDNTKPFRVTLAWTDTPGPTTGNAFVNNLDLEVTIGGQTYKGNVFTAGLSTAGGAADPRNNMENVFLPAGVSGNFSIKVKGTNIAGDGVPGNADLLDQDFALVAYNANEAPLPIIGPGSTTVTAESCAPANNAIDSGETVTVNFTLINEGTAPTTNLVATLDSTGGVSSPSGPQNYGALAADGGSATRPFTFTANGSCGGTLTATFQLQDGASNLGTVTFTFTLGVLNVVFSENFDGVVAPALPAGWTTAFTNGDGDCTVGGPLCTLGSNWTTVNTSSDTAPNSAFHNDPSCVTNNVLDSPNISINTTNAQVTFRHSFNTEDTFDGSVLEVSSPNINAGAFTDITNAAVGGSFVTGGYTDTISTSFLSPIAGRQAWSGNSGGFITTVANLGPNVLGQTIKLRFRFASDCSVGVTGHNIDTVTVSDGFACCGFVGSPNIVSGTSTLVSESCPPNNNAVDPNERVTLSLQLRNTGTAATTNLVATLQSSPSVISPSGPQNYGAIAIGGNAARDFAFTANATCGGSITLNLQLQDGASNLGTVTFTIQVGTLAPGAPVTFSNPTAITIPSVGVGTPYPSNITVSGLSTSIAAVTVTLTNLTHTFPDDVDLLLVSPSGRKMIIMSDAGGGNPGVTNVTITLDDAAATAIPDSAALTTGSFRPGNYLTVQDPFAAPAPAGPYLTPQTGGSDTLTSAFTGAAGGNPNGTWSLFVVDDASGDLGSIAGGWSLSITPLVAVCTTPCGPPVASGDLIISEFRSRGPGGASDEFVELYNNTDLTLNVNAADASSGFALATSDGVAKFVIPNGTAIPARGHFLGVNSGGYSLGSYPAGNGTTATGDITYAVDIGDNVGIALFNTSNPANFNLANRLDAVGSNTEANTTYREGIGYPPVSTAALNYSFFRNLRTGRPQDTNNNFASGTAEPVSAAPQNDFVFADTAAALTPAGQRLGAPGPENLSSPIERNSTVKASLVSPCVSSAAVPNRVRTGSGNSGTLEIRRKFTNNTGAPVTRLRFRIVDITGQPFIGGFADLRAVTSTSSNTDPQPCGGGTVSLTGLTLETPPTQGSGGGFNSTLSAGTITAGSPIAPGATINVNFLLNIVQAGTFRFFVTVEALP